MSVNMDCLLSICLLNFNQTLLMLCFTYLETMIVAPVEVFVFYFHFYSKYKYDLIHTYYNSESPSKQV